MSEFPPFNLIDGTPVVVYLGCGHHETAAASALRASNLGASSDTEPTKS